TWPRFRSASTHLPPPTSSTRQPDRPGGGRGSSPRESLASPKGPERPQSQPPGRVDELATGPNRRNRRLLPTTKALENAIATPTIDGFSSSAPRSCIAP